jgi:hypothetical protein
MHGPAKDRFCGLRGQLISAAWVIGHPRWQFITLQQRQERTEHVAADGLIALVVGPPGGNPAYIGPGSAYFGDPM